MIRLLNVDLRRNNLIDYRLLAFLNILITNLIMLTVYGLNRIEITIIPKCLQEFYICITYLQMFIFLFLLK